MPVPKETTAGDQPRRWFWREEALCAAGLFLAVLGLYSLTWFQGLGVSVSTIGAERVLRGEIPYRDFWTMYAPGHFYLLAMLFRFFGTHILVETVAASVVCAAAGVLCYSLVHNLAGRRFAAIASAGILVAATFNTGYFKSLGSYPPALFFVLAALNLILLYYKSGQLGYLLAAGVATGAVVAFKHDVGGYTAVAILAGLIAHCSLFPATTPHQARSALSTVAFFSVGVAVIVLPLSILFGFLAGKAVLQDLIIFPLTDFRFARPEHYPGLFEFDIHGKSFLNSLLKLFEYLKFALPFILFFFGLAAIGVAARRRKRAYVALGVTGSVAFLLHYFAAHVQINTHIISMSVYGFLLGVIVFHLLEDDVGLVRPAITRLFGRLLVGVWVLALTAEPVDRAWSMRRWLTTELKVGKVSGLKVSAEGAENLYELLTVVNTYIRPDENVFVGLHRHDVVIVGANAADYFILDRPIATRYHELHPAVADTADVQREIIRDLQDKNVSLIILKRIKPDDRLEIVKRDFLRNLPQIGATDLDAFIRANYVEVKRLGSNAIWKRKDDTHIGAGGIFGPRPGGASS